MSTQNANNVNISGGSLNNVTVGLTTPRDAAFANLTLTGSLTSNNSTGTAGQVLTSNGSSSAAYWSTPTGAQSAGNSSILLNNVNITSNATISAGQNGFSVGPVTTANGVSVTIASGQQWVVI
jgi:hypothetical protein